MRPIFCFIDDSPFELEVFSRNIVPAAPEIEFILGSTYKQIQTELEDRYPVLFLLDLYGLETRGVPHRALLLRTEFQVVQRLAASLRMISQGSDVGRQRDDLEASQLLKIIQYLFLLGLVPHQRQPA